MITLIDHSSEVIFIKPSNTRHGERGAALAIALLMMILLSAIALGILAVVQGESKIAGSDLKRTQACYAASASIEMMTNDFSALFAHTSRPTQGELDAIEADVPTVIPGYTFTDHTLKLNTDAVTAMGADPTVNIPNGPFAGLIAGLSPYTLTTTAQSSMAQCTVKRDMNNYLIPLFQFGMFSDKDIELHPGAAFTFNGRIHANGNIYASGGGPVKFLDKVTTANEFIYQKLRNDQNMASNNVSMDVGNPAVNVVISMGSMTGGPNITSATATPAGQRGYFPDSPNGTINPSWNTTSVATANGTANRLGGQLLTRSTGGAQLKLPLQLDNNPTRELIKRRMPNDTPAAATTPSALSDSRYHSKAKIRILIDDEGVTNDRAGLYATQNGTAVETLGVNLSGATIGSVPGFNPMRLPNVASNASPAANGGGRALWRINDNNTGVANSYNETATSFVRQYNNGALVQADTVRGVRAAVAPPAPVLFTIRAATNANPIEIRTDSNHGYATGDQVVISGVNGNTNANGVYTITRIGNDRFTLNGRNGNANYSNSNTDVAYRIVHTPMYNALGATPAGHNHPILAGAGITGHIVIQIVDATTNKVIRDVTREILSLGMTEGEPNAIVQLQRPLWASFTQGGRDASSTNNGGANNPYNGDSAYRDCLTGTFGIFENTHIGATGQIDTLSASPPTPDATNGYLTDIEAPANGQPTRPDISNFAALNSADWADQNLWLAGGQWNAIVPINVYNVREGRITSTLAADAIYERGITNVVEINMINLARWMDGVFDNNLLAGTAAISANIAKPDGYVVYVSDRRGDNVNTMTDLSGASISSSNGMVDNEDIYEDDALNPGEDVQEKKTFLVKDITEMQDPIVRCGTTPAFNGDRTQRAIQVAMWRNTCGYFRQAVRLFDAETLQTAGARATDPLSTILGITISSENMVYTWGNYNTTGINAAPPTGIATLNEPELPDSLTYFYLPIKANSTQVPTSIVADAFFPLSKTWFDSSGAMYPDNLDRRVADLNNAGFADETSVRVGVIAGNNLGAKGGNPDAGNGGNSESRLNGGMHNFPRFLEKWTVRFNFVGSMIPLWYSTQALGQYNNNSTIYGAPIRNWAFDSTFLKLNRLPPGTPMFQYILPTAFRQVQ